MGWIKKFKAASERKQRDRVNRQLEKIADALPERIAEARIKISAFKSAGRGGINVVRNASGDIVSASSEMCNDVGSVSEVKGLQLYDAKTLPGYKRLHEICAKADVHMSRIPVASTAYIGFGFDGSYKKSPDAYFFTPKRPVWIQDAIPGL
jgi:hypothetical protein